MIFDLMKNFASYSNLSEAAWKKVERFLAECPADCAFGRYEIDGDAIYAMIQDNETHAVFPEKLEIHKKYIDIQLLLAGEEIIVYRDVENLKESVPYNETKDIAFYHHKEEGAVPLVLIPGNFAVFFPWEGHMPGVYLREGESLKVRKCVVKIAADLFPGLK